MKWIACILMVSMLLSLFGCGAEPEQATEGSVRETYQGIELPQGISLNLLRNVEPRTAAGQQPDERFSGCANEFAVSLLQSSYVEGENTVLSPYSVMIALAMAANGAEGQTLEQMEQLLGLPRQELNAYLWALQQAGGKELVSANSLWIHQELPVQEDFLQSIADHYAADVYSSPFTEEVLGEINDWIKERTAGRIENALDKMNPNAMIYLINALSFDGEWKKPYNTSSVLEDTFHASSGDQRVTMLNSEEQFYLESETATGFMKDYAGEQYSFVAILPREGISLSDYLDSLSSDELQRMIEEAQSTTVMTQMPKCKLESSLELQEVLSTMGMVDAFTKDANFAGIEPSQQLFISRVLHKTSVSIDEKGTQAGAVTIEEFVTKGAFLEVKQVFLNRPYVMGIYDKLNGCFLFLGAVNEIE